jgi:4'-phosphopantetheinyl transferase
MPAPPRHKTHRAFGYHLETWIKQIHLTKKQDPPQERWLLPPEEQRQMMAIPFYEDRIRYAAGRTLVRHVLGRKLGIPPRLVPIVADAQGRPHLAYTRPVGCRLSSDPEGYDFNLSHAGDYLALVVATGLQVGIDIERLSWHNASIELAKRYFTNREYEILVRTGPDEYLQRWYRIWTTREAYAKALGVGVLHIGMSLAGYGIEWTCLSVPTINGYVCSVVALSPKMRRSYE